MWIELETMSGMKSMVNMEMVLFVSAVLETELWIDSEIFSFSTKEDRDAKYEEIKRLIGGAND